MVARFVLVSHLPLVLPRRKAGHRSEGALQLELARDQRLCQWLEARWRDTGLAFGARGWGYVLEGEGVIDKGDLDACERWLTRMRKQGLLHPDVVADDEARAADYVEQVDDDDPDDYAAWVAKRADAWLGEYTPVSFWDGLDHYVEAACEKIDLKLLFGPTCDRYQVALTNFKGSTDLNSRRRMLIRFREHWRAGRKPVLLYCPLGSKP